MSNKINNTRKIKSSKTAEQRRAQAEQLQASITDQVDQLRNCEQWIRFLQFARSFHSYSLSNLILIMAQCPDATRVAGVRQWQAKGRQVHKGEKSIKIFGYAEKKITSDADQDDDGAAEDERVVYFPILSVFDISQTDPNDPDDDPLTIGEGRLNSEDPHPYRRRRDRLPHRAGLERPPSDDPRSGRLHGSSIPPSRHSGEPFPTDTAATLLHEAAHVILHARDPAGAYQQHRGIKETEAESVAYVVAVLLGLGHQPDQHQLCNWMVRWRHRHYPGHSRASSRGRTDPEEGLITEETEHSAA